MSFNRLSKVLFLLCFLFAAPANALIAQTFKIEGRILDTKGSALPGANVVLMDVNEKTVTGKVTDRKGNFELPEVRKGKYKLKVTYIGYDTYEKAIDLLSDLDLKTIKIKQTGVTTDEVIVEGKMNLATQKKDTTEYNAGAFKVNKDASAEDLVKKMPGVQVEQDGTLKAQGENVKKVFVDGKQFFGDDPSIAMKNLPADVIDKVQVYDKMSDQAEFSGFDDGNSYKAMNITTKNNKRNGKFGRLYAGGGDQGKYIASGNFNLFDGDSRLTILGLSNNINQQNFMHDDILGAMGGNSRIPRQFQQMGASMMRSGAFSQGGGMGGGFGRSNDFFVGQSPGKNSTNSLGVNYSDVFFEKVKFAGSYFFNLAKTQGNQLLDQSYYLDTNNLNVHQINKSENDNYNHRVNLEMNWQIDSSNSIMIKPRISYQQNNTTASTYSQSISKKYKNDQDNNTKSNSDGYNFNNDFLYRLRLNNVGRTISLGINNQINDKESNSRYNSIYLFDSTLSTPDYTDTNLVNLNTNYPRKTVVNSANALYTEPLGRSMQLNFSYNISNTKSDADKKTYSYDSLSNSYSVLDSTYSNIFTNDYTTQRIGTGWRFRNENTNLSLGVNYQMTGLKNDQSFPRDSLTSYKFNNLLPSMQLVYKFSETNRLWLNYRTSTNIPSIEQLQNVVDISVAQQVSTGNPNLKQEFSHNIMMRYSDVDIVKGRIFFSMLSVGFRNNYIATSTFLADKADTIDGTPLAGGQKYLKPVNLDGNINVTTFLTYGLPVSFLYSNLNTNVGFFYTRNPGLYNNIESFTNSYIGNCQFVLGSNISEDVDFTLSSRTTYTISSNNLNSQSNQNYWTQYSTVFLKYTFWKDFFVQGDVSSNIYFGATGTGNPNITLVNFGMGYKLFSDNSGELKFSGNDLLKQNKAVNRTITDSYIENTRTDVLQRYFLLTFTYNMRKV